MIFAPPFIFSECFLYYFPSSSQVASHLIANCIEPTMARKGKKGKKDGRSVEASGNPIIEVQYKDPLFAIAAHPTEPVFVSGLATGHVLCNRYDADRLEQQMRQKKEEMRRLAKASVKGSTPNKWWTLVDDINNTDEIVTGWKTKRHKGSCRLVLFDPIESLVGKHIYTVGKDHVIKKAATETGKVVSKTSIAQELGGTDAVTKLCHSATHPFLLAGTEDGGVLVYDSNNLSNKFHIKNVHDDAVNQLLAMPAKSAYHYLSVGATTLSHIDIRKGVITQSDDQEDELLSMSFVPDDDRNDTVLVAHGNGIVTIWKDSKNKLMDQLSRIKVNKNASIDAMTSAMDAGEEDIAASVWCGDSDGIVHRVNYKKGRVVETRFHGDDEVGFLDIDAEYRLLTAGMDSMKLWLVAEDEEDEEESDESEESEESGDNSSSGSGSDSDGDDSISDASESDASENGSELDSDDSNEESVDASEDYKSERISGNDVNDATISYTKDTKPEHNPPKPGNNLRGYEPEAKPESSRKKQKLKETSKLATSHGIRKFEGL